jgi:hypothetical protein
MSSAPNPGLLRRWTPGPPFGLSHLLVLVSGARLNVKHAAIYISHITSRRQVEQDQRVAKGIIDDEVNDQTDWAPIRRATSTAAGPASVA